LNRSDPKNILANNFGIQKSDFVAFCSFFRGSLNVCDRSKKQKSGDRQLFFNISRYLSASTTIENGILISGGISKIGRLKTTELVYSNGTIVSGKENTVYRPL
jgi:hypothetical protein